MRKAKDKEMPAGIKELTVLVRTKTDESQNRNIYELNLAEAETKKRERQKGYLRNAIRNCCKGDSSARDYVREYIRGLLENEIGVNDSNIKDYVPIYGDGRTTAADRFELMCAHFLVRDPGPVFLRIYDSLSEKKRSDEGELLCITEQDINECFFSIDFRPTYQVLLEFLSQRIYEQLYGFGPADILIFDRCLDGISAGCGGISGRRLSFSEEAAFAGEKVPEGKDTVYVMFRGRTVHLKFLAFESEETLARTVRKLASHDAAVPLSRKNPALVSSLKDNSRVVTLRPPAAASWCFFVRRFTSKEASDFKDLITDKGAEYVEYLLRNIIAGEQNLVISGNQGGGKTTLLKALIGYIDPSYTLRVAEGSFEANINCLYPDRNVVSLQERGQFTVFDALTAFKKTDSDVIILGEVNEPKIAGALVQIVQNGGRMVMTTLHHVTTRKMIDYLRNALISEYGIRDTRIAEEQAVDAVNFDVHMVRDRMGHHYISRITEVVPTEGKLHTYECHNLIEYDVDEHRYRVTGVLSDEALMRMEETLGRNETGAVQASLQQWYKCSQGIEINGGGD